MSRKENKARHFATEDWVDLANGQVTGERLESMQRHLNSCEECGSALALWTRVSQAANFESSYAPPESAVRHIRNSFAMSQPLKQRRPIEIPRLVFDSLWQPALIGVRSSASAPRQLLYRAGNLAIEMRIEPEPGSERVNIAGQISKAAPSCDYLAGVPVLVSGKKGTVAKASTNDFGEFHVAVLAEEGLHISFDIPTELRVSIPLEGQAAAASYSG